MPIGSLIKLPVDIDHETAAAMTMRGLSAAYWLLKTNPWMKSGDTILLHAAAGGVGLIAVAMGEAARPAGHRHGVDAGKGRRSPEAHGCDEIIFYRQRRRRRARSGTDGRRRRDDGVRHRGQGHVRRRR